MYGYIYITTNTVNGKKYIGQHASERFVKSYKGSGRYLSNAVKKYGSQNFKVEILEWCETKEDLDSREMYWIAFYDAVKSDKFYNLTVGGEGIRKGSKFSDETRQKMSKGHKGKKFTDDHKKKIANAISGENHYLYNSGDKLTENQKSGLEVGRHLPASPKLKQKLSEYRKNVVVSDSTKQKLSDNAKGRKYITKDGQNKLVYPNEIQQYISDGWKLGRSTPWMYKQ